MGVNFVVKPIATYAGVSDTNGGGYVDVLGATYANFCSSSGGPLYTNIEPTTYGYDSTGLYDITHSMTVPTGVICYCRYADDSASTTLYFYAYLVNADNWQMVYLPVGGTGISSQAVIDDAISNAEAGDELLLLAVGGALATIEAGANLAKVDGYTLMIEGPATYVRTAGITDIVNLIVMGVDSNGVEAIGDNRPEEDLATNSIQYGWTLANGVCELVFLSYISKIYTASGVTTALVYAADANQKDIIINGCTVYATGNRYTSHVVYGLQSIHVNVTSMITHTDVINLAYISYTSSPSEWLLSDVYAEVNIVVDGRFWWPGTFSISNSIFKCNSVYSRALDRLSINNCVFIAQSSSSELTFLSSAQTSGRFMNCILIGYASLTKSTTDYAAIINCAYLDCGFGDSTNEFWQNNIELSADPFVDSANGDYRLDPAGPDFDKLYDTTTGRVLIGATGPEMTTGGGGGISSARYIGGV